MSNKIKIAIGLAVALVVGLIWFTTSISYKNQEVALRTQAEACQQANEARYDEVWKSIKQIANVTDKYAADFKAVYVGMMEGRYSADKGSNPMFKMINEANPSFDSAMYTKLADTINAQRSGFTRDQKRLIDIKREHDLLLQSIPSKWFLKGVEPLEIAIVTSTKTKEAFKTGIDDDVTLF